MTCKKITLHRKCSFPHLMRPNPQVTADLVIFFEEIFNGKLNFLCSVTNAFHLIRSGLDSSLC